MTTQQVSRDMPWPCILMISKLCLISILFLLNPEIPNGGFCKNNSQNSYSISFFFFCKILRILIPNKSLTKEVSIGDKSRKELPVNCNELLTKIIIQWAGKNAVFFKFFMNQNLMCRVITACYCFSLFQWAFKCIGPQFKNLANLFSSSKQANFSPIMSPLLCNQIDEYDVDWFARV